MSPRVRFISLLAFFCVVPTHTFSQYFGDRVLEKSFEETEFFFRPSYVIPYGIGNFKSTLVGLVDDPLLNLALNPANLYNDSISSHYIYADARTLPERTRSYGIYPEPMIPYAAPILMNDIQPYPVSYFRTRREVEPLASAAYLARPFSNGLRKIFLAASYQGIFQDERYYQPTEDIYYPVIGHSYSGARLFEGAPMPIYDRSAATDNMHNIGHFLSFWSGIELDESMTLGIKVARAIFDREGSYGFRNDWSSPTQPTSYSSNLENRDQRYRHWDVSIGVVKSLSDKVTAGLTLGYLWGTADQFLNRDAFSYSRYGQTNAGNEWSFYDNTGFTRSAWNHSGKLFYSGIHTLVRLNPGQVLRISYSIGREKTDLLLSSRVEDASSSDYRWRGYPDTVFSRGTSSYTLRDYRGGDGQKTSTFHRFLTALQWDLKPQLRASFGLQVEVENRATATKEHVSARRQAQYNSSGYGTNYNRFERFIEEKDLLWNFQTRVTTIQIPFILLWNISEHTELTFGFNRRMASWRTEETTVALFSLHEQTIDTVTTVRQNFGERYTSPRELMSDVSTTFLAGVSFAPSAPLRIRFLLVPSVENTFNGTDIRLNWWIAVNLYP